MTLIPRPVSSCPVDPTHQTVRMKKIKTNGAIQVFDWCVDCDRFIKENGLWIPHKEAGDIESLPLQDDYRPKYGEPCVVCGSREGSEYHHWAPRNIFTVEAENWPGSFLCRKHHNYWHDRMTDYKRYERHAD